ncbi:Cupin domain protein [compost metagenome]
MSEITPGAVFFLDQMISVRPGRISSRSLVFPVTAGIKAAEPDWVLYAMDQGETISAETSPYPKLIQVLEGELTMLVDEQPCSLPAGASVWVGADTWHEFAAPVYCKFVQIKF